MSSLITYYNKEINKFENNIDYLNNKNKELYGKIYNIVQDIKYYNKLLLELDDIVKIEFIKNKIKKCNKNIDIINEEIIANDKNIFVNYPLYIEKNKELIKDKLFLNNIKKYYMIVIITLLFIIIIIKKI